MIKKTILAGMLSVLSVNLSADILQQRELYSKKELNLPFKISATFQAKKDVMDNYYLNGDMVNLEKEIMNNKLLYGNSKIEKAIISAYYAKVLNVQGKYDKAIDEALLSYEIFTDLGYNFQQEKYLMSKYLIDALSYSDVDDKDSRKVLLDLIVGITSYNDIDLIEKYISTLRYKIKIEKMTYLIKNNRLKELESFIEDPLKKENGLKIQTLGLMTKYYKRLNNEYESVKYADQVVQLISKDPEKNDLFNIEALDYAIESYMAYEKFDKAKENIFKLEKIYKKYFSPDDIIFANLYTKLSATLKNLKEYEESIKYNLISLEKYKSVYGEESLEMVDLYSNLSDLYLQKKDIKNALEVLNKAYLLSIKKNGKYDFNTKLIKQNFDYINALKEHE